MQHIVTCAWALFNKYGFESVTMDAIATAADVARGTLYKHFPVKEALIAHRFRQDQLQHQALVQEAALAAPSIKAAFLTVLQLEAAYAERMRSFIAPYVFYRLSHAQENANPFENDSFAPLALQLLQQGQSDGVISRDITARTLAENLIFLRLATMLRWLREPNALLADLYAEMLHAFFHGAASRTTTLGE
ncbi:helix-turn-helix domain-containing protein [Iodobacter sp. LRB]|uniref:TetR/AcrR family transcriptional regulator n=1 Tax=unclassified Iodobacter TaxID=235634 RepID=UPI0015D4FA2F|nr:TetR/AcrR family transcriptional regulator [Iodobacter sp. BJB302]